MFNCACGLIYPFPLAIPATTGFVRNTESEYAEFAGEATRNIYRFIEISRNEEHREAKGTRQFETTWSWNLKKRRKIRELDTGDGQSIGIGILFQERKRERERGPLTIGSHQFSFGENFYNSSSCDVPFSAPSYRVITHCSFFISHKISKARRNVTTSKEFVSLERSRVNGSRVISFGKYWMLKSSVYRTAWAHSVARWHVSQHTRIIAPRCRRTVRHCDCSDTQSVYLSSSVSSNRIRIWTHSTWRATQQIACREARIVPRGTSYASSVCSPLQLFSTTRRQSVTACLLLQSSLSLSLFLQETAETVRREEDSALYLNACLRFIVYRVYRSVCRGGGYSAPDAVVSSLSVFFSLVRLSWSLFFSLFSVKRS